MITAADGSLTSATQTETVIAAAAGKLQISTAPQALTAGVTSGPITVQLDDPFNNVATATSTQTVQLTTSSTAAFGVHFRDTADTIDITSVTIGAGTSSASFKYKDTLAGSPLLTATDSPLTAVSQTETVSAAAASKLVITTAPQTLTAGVTSGPITVQLDDPFNNVATAASTQTVLLTTSSTAPFGVHFRDTADATNITSVTISTGASSASFKYNDTLAGSPLLTATDSPLTAVSQTETVSAAAASKLVITTAPQALIAGVTSGPITVQLDDPFNNVATAASTQTVLLTTSSTAPFGVHFRDTADATNITSVTISTGASSASFKYNDTLAGSPLLTATDSPLTAVSQTETVSAAAASKLVITTAPQTLTAGVTSGPITVQLDDPFNNVATAATTQTVLLTTSSTAPFGVHFRDTADATNITSVAISTGASSASFKYNDTLAGSPLLTVADAPLTSASQSETVNAAGASKLVITTAPQTLTAGVPSSPITVQLDDPFNNVATAASTQTVLLTTSSTAPFGVHFRDTADITNITSVTINTGASSASFKYNDTLTGSPLLTAADSPLTSATQTETVIAAGAAKLVITTQPAGAMAGVAFVTQPVVMEEDAFNNVITADSTNLVTAARGSHGTANLQGSTLSATLHNGVAMFAGLSYNIAETMNVLFSTTAGVFTATSTDVVVSPNTTASQLVFGQQPTNATAGAPLGPVVTVKIEDQFGNVETGDTTSTLNIVIASGPTDGVFTSDSTTLNVPVSAGVATFTTLKLNSAGTYSLQATDAAPTLTSAASSPFTISPDVANQLAFGSQPSNTDAGNPVSPAVTVKIEDRFGNPETGDNGTLLALGVATGPNITPNGNTAIVHAGVATFSSLVIHQPGNYTLQATGASLTSPASTGFTISSPIQLVFGQQPTDTVAGSLMAPVTVNVEDPFGTVETGDNHTSLSIAIASGPANAVFAAGSTTTVTVSGGVATFDNLALNTAGNYTFIVTDTAIGVSTLNSTSFTISPSAADKLVFVQQPSNTTAGVALSTAVKVEILDAYDNLRASDSSSRLNLAINTGPTGAVIASGSNITATVSGGVATFSTLIFNTAGAYTLQASDASASLTPATFASGPFTVSPAAASQLAFTTLPQALTAGVSSGTITIQLDGPVRQLHERDQHRDDQPGVELDGGYCLRADHADHQLRFR